MACSLMKDGEELETVGIVLMENHQDAKFIDQLFTESDTSDFSGTAHCEATGRVTGVALELDWLSDAVGVFTTLPVISRPSGADLFQ